METNKKFNLVAPKGLRKAVSIIMVVLGSLSLLSAIIFLANLVSLDTSSDYGKAVYLVYLIDSVVYFLQGALYLSCGIVGLVKQYDGSFHKKLVTAVLIGICSIILISNIVSLAVGGGDVMPVVYLVGSLASITFFVLSLVSGKKGDLSQRTFGIVGVAILMGVVCVSDIVSIVNLINLGGNPTTTILSLLFSIALYLVYLFYFIKLTPEAAVPLSHYLTPEDVKLANPSESDKAEAIKQYKDLLDKGIITQEEFEKKKADLLK